MLWTVDAVLWVCVTVSLVLLTVFIWQWSVGGRMSPHTSVVMLLAVPLIAQRLWNVGEAGLAEDRTLARSAFGVFGAAVVVGSQLAAAYVLFR